MDSMTESRIIDVSVARIRILVPSASHFVCFLLQSTIWNMHAHSPATDDIVSMKREKQIEPLARIPIIGCRYIPFIPPSLALRADTRSTPNQGKYSHAPKSRP